ncbi:MAG: Gfo/Idh/MocA family oxidoreductase [Caldilineaceae bacterium]|nr:Gfo/Idh/MocA family oxidoreductase [Caldilineaceae bacterium]
MNAQQPIRLAVVGGRRGGSFRLALQSLAERLTLTTICDLSEEVLAQWRADHPGIQTYSRYEDLLDDAAVDAVLLATPMYLHAGQAVQALRAGKHVLSEVIAATTLDECWELVETVEQTGRTYMLAENYCYMRPNRMVLNMAQQGVFGEITFAEGGYIHDCRYLIFNADGSTTWRGEMRRIFNGNGYPTHSLGPVAQWLGINRGDRLVSTATWVSKACAAQLYARDHLGPDHPATEDRYWQLGDSATTLIQTAKGALIVLRMDSNSARPHNMTHYTLQGTQAAYLSARHHKEDPLIWIDGRSPGASPGDAEWESLWNYSDEYEHPDWREWRAVAQKAGHGGGDFFVLRDFVQAIETGSPPPIDVYDAVTWSVIMPLSAQSVAQGGAPVAVPDFRRGNRSL